MQNKTGGGGTSPVLVVSETDTDRFTICTTRPDLGVGSSVFRPIPLHVLASPSVWPTV